jgi:hypothetical protein
MPLPITYDTTKSLEQLENSYWSDEIEFPSALVINCHLYRKKALDTLTVEELRLLIGQNIGLPYLTPIALNILENNPFAKGDCYPGDLLHNTLRSNVSHWKVNAIQATFLLKIIQKYKDELKSFIYKEYEDETGLFPNPEINDYLDKSISNFKINISEIQNKL